MLRTLLVCSLGLLLTTAVVGQQTPEKIEVGKPAPDFTVTGVDGKKFKLSEKIAKGKNVALMFSRAHW